MQNLSEFLVDEFSDDASMSVNSLSAFYARSVANASRWSNHAYGLAIDSNREASPFFIGG